MQIGTTEVHIRVAAVQNGILKLVRPIGISRKAKVLGANRIKYKKMAESLYMKSIMTQRVKGQSQGTETENLPVATRSAESAPEALKVDQDPAGRRTDRDTIPREIDIRNIAKIDQVLGSVRIPKTVLREDHRTEETVHMYHARKGRIRVAGAGKDLGLRNLIRLELLVQVTVPPVRRIQPRGSYS